MHYFIIAGEASGDLHAAQLIRALRVADPAARFTFLGGDLMAAAAGSEPLIHYRDMAFMGFSEVLRHLPAVLGNLRTARKALRETRPDAFIAVDYPSFNLKVAASASAAGIPVFYFISPKLWAWKSWRVKAIRRHVRRVLAIFPFEPQWYADHGFRADYVGNPSVAEIDAALASAPTRDDFLLKHRLRDRPLIALLPGSRRGEVRSNLPVMVQAAKRFAQYRPVVACAPGLDDEFYRGITDGLPLLRDATVPLLRHARAALVTSGTATLEAALAGTPQVVCYRSNGSKLTYDIMKRVLDISHVSLPNIIAGREIVPEMLLHRCTPDLVAERLAPLLRDTPERASQTEGYAEMRRILGTQDAAASATRLIVGDLRS